MAEATHIQSIEASNSIEGIYICDERLKLIALDKTMPKTRNEFEIAGYRDVLNTINYIVHNGMLKDMSVLLESPFTDKGSVAEVFADMTVWMGIRKVIERINSNAVA